MYEKYNAVLRAESGDTFLVQKCEALTKGNRYATSIHAVTSCVLKLAKVTKSCTVYRGLKDAQDVIALVSCWAGVGVRSAPCPHCPPGDTLKSRQRHTSVAWKK